MLDLEKPIVTVDGRAARVIARDVPGDKPFLISFENEVTGELTSGTFSQVQLQHQFKNEVVPETFIYEIVLQQGVPLLVGVNGQDDVMEGSHCVAVTILGEQVTGASLLEGTGKPEGWAMIEGGQEVETSGNLQEADMTHRWENGMVDVTVRVPAEQGEQSQDDVGSEVGGW